MRGVHVFVLSHNTGFGFRAQLALERARTLAGTQTDTLMHRTQGPLAGMPARPAAGAYVP